MKKNLIQGQSADVDTGERGLKAVVISLTQREGDLLRLSFDDGERQPGTESLTITGFFTHHDFPIETFREMKLTKDDLANIGLAAAKSCRASPPRAK